MLHSALIAVVGIMALMAFWVGVQHLARRATPHTPPEQDMLEFMLHRCHACEHATACAEVPPTTTCPHPGEASPNHTP